MSLLAREAAEAAECIARQIEEAAPAVRELRSCMRSQPRFFVVTCARGSSDHAATFGKYLIETATGLPVASFAPSVTSIYERSPDYFETAFIAVSQSGRSPDIVQAATVAKQRGAFVIGLVNDTSSPLAAVCNIVVPLCAGEEKSIAATKSFLCSCFAFVQLVAAWLPTNENLPEAIARAPEAIAAAARLDWSTPLASLATAKNLYVVGRGYGYAAALEMALKLKETCRLHAEAFSTAELRHGPIALVEPGFPIVALSQEDATADHVRDAIAYLRSLGADVTSTLDALPTVRDLPGYLAPICQVQSFYLALPSLARARGLDADAPLHLSKVTRTI